MAAGRWMGAALTLIWGGAAWAQPPDAERNRPEWHRAPFLTLRDPQSVNTRFAGESASSHAVRGGQGRALSTAAADFDEDGMPDLAAGFALPDGSGAVSIHRGNVDALWPYGALRGTDPPAFLPDARVFALPEAPDFLAAGDFDADGHWDLVAARAGSPFLYLLKGDGHGGFADAERIALPGTVTAMTSGEINRTDGLTDLMVAVTGSGGPRALVYESPRGALRGEPEAFPLPADAAALAVTPLDGGVMNGLAVAAGRELWLIHGRDRRLTGSRSERDSVAAAELTRQIFSFELRSLAVGHFTSNALDLAALGDDGQIHILERSDANDAIPVAVAVAELAMGGRRPRTRGSAGPMPRTTAMRARTAVGLPLSASQPGGARLVTARIAATGRDSLIVIDPAGRMLHVVSHPGREDGATMAVTASLDVAGAPAAVEPMRINKDALSDLVVLTSQQSQPIVLTTAPDYILTVLNASDNQNNSLRSRIDGANLYLSAGFTAEVDFNIPVTDPDRDPVTGVFTIQPIFQNALVALSTLGGITVDGYTQPGASPNTLATGDNAHLLIEVNGSMAGKGPDGLALFGGVNVVRGLAVTNFLGTPDQNDPRYVDGGGGFTLQSDGNIVEGNFVGIDAGGTLAKPNSEGFFTESDQFTSFGQTIGGTTPQARNIVSGNTFSGIFASQVSYANTFFIRGNYIGADKTGTHAIPNGYAGVDIIGVNDVVGGATAGAANLISGNGTFGVVAQIIGLGGNNIQGNLIGPDITGAQALGFQTGVGMAAASGNLIGGTTPAARNIISGNSGAGIWFVGGAENILIQGNYIGLDITGSQALPNTIGVHFDTDFKDIFGAFHSGGPVTASTIGGEAAGAGNVISGNKGGGISVNSKTGFAMNNAISGNLIGTDASGLNPLGNQGDGILIYNSSTTNTVGGTDPSAANTIAYNTGNGVTIDPGSPNTATFGASADSVIGNFIYSNGGTGVRVASGTQNKISQNRIYSNGGLGIDIDAGGVLANSAACPQNTSGANNLQNAPVLTAASGATFITATATDPAGNTSEFSNCAAASLSGNLLTIAGTFSSTPGTTYTIEYFSNAACDASGFGEGKTYLGSTTVTTNASCTATLSGTLDLTKADLSVVYTGNTSFSAVTNETFTVATLVTNKGPIAASAATWTDTLPAGLQYLSAGATQGACTFAAGTITCNLGDIVVGGTVTVTAYVIPTADGAFSNTVSVASSTPDGNPANNSASVTKTSIYSPLLNHLSPSSVYVGSPDLALTLVGQGFEPSSQVTYGGVSYPVTFNGNWNPADCGDNLAAAAQYCTALVIHIPASQFTATATVPVNVVTTGIGAGSQTLQFQIVTPPVVAGPLDHFVLSGLSNPFPAGSLGLLFITAVDAAGLTVTSYHGTVNLTSTDPNPTVFTAGGQSATLPFPNNKGGQGDIVVSLQTIGTQSITATDSVNTAIKGTLAGIVVSHGPAAALTLTGSPQAALPGHAFAAPLAVKVVDLYGNPVPNQLVTYTAPTSGPSAVLSSSTATTNAQGVASVTATANSTSGVYAVGVTFGAAVAGGGANADVYLLTNGTGLATLTATAGTPQSTFIGTLFANKLQATLKDGLGNPIVGASVYFSSGNVNGAGAIVVSGVATTDANGVAQTSVNLPSNSSAGTFPVYATAGGLTATFTLTALTPNPVVITITGGSPQTTTVGAAFAIPLSVHVADGLGNARPGVVVTFVPPSSGASATFTTGTASTDGAGNASITPTANNTLGTYNVTASVGSVSVTFVLTNGPNGSGPPASIAATAGTPQSQFVHQAFGTALKVLVKDAGNIPLAGASVTFTAPATGPSGAFTGSATVTTNGVGIATAPTFTANTVAGSYTVTATAGAVSATFSLTNLGGAPTTMNFYAGNNQSTTIGTAFDTNLAVQLVDQYGNPSGANWGPVLYIVVAGGNGASGSFATSTSVNTDSNGIATAPVLTANGTAGAWNVFVLYNSLFQTFNLTNVTGSPAFLVATTGSTPQTTAVNTAFAAPLSAKVTDAGGNPLAGFTVTFTAPTSGAGATLSSASALTNASGIASVTATANAFSGSYNVHAAIRSLSLNFGLTNTGGVVNKCDVNQDLVVDIKDVQQMVSEMLTLNTAHDLNQDSAQNVVDGQIVINAAITGVCSAR